MVARLLLLWFAVVSMLEAPATKATVERVGVDGGEDVLESLSPRDFTSSQAVAAAGEPALFKGLAAGKGPVHIWDLEFLAGQYGAKKFQFDVAGLPTSEEEGAPLGQERLPATFDFKPYYKNGGYALEARCTAECPTTKLAGPRARFCSHCHGSDHVRQDLSFHDFRGLVAAGRAIGFAKLGPNNMTPLMQRQMRALAHFSNNHVQDESESELEGPRDFDVWAGSAGWRSATHYDLQDNFYVQVSGRKLFLVASPALRETFGLFPHSHPRHRQTVELMLGKPANDSETPVYSVLLEPGDVLFIPGFFLHTAFAVSDSVSVAVCSPSAAERAAFRLEGLPIPLEEDWSSSHKAAVLSRYLSELEQMVLGASGEVWSRKLLSYRFLPLFSSHTHVLEEVVDLFHHFVTEDPEIIRGRGLVDPELLPAVEEAADANTSYQLAIDGDLAGDEVLPQRGAASNALPTPAGGDPPVEAALKAKLKDRSIHVRSILSAIPNPDVTGLVLENFAETLVDFFFGEALLPTFFVAVAEAASGGEEKGLGLGSWVSTEKA
uniref:JmjC domain-containing protein n=1 Tax=Rhizochromulina marina TaxID=1034831 RepID=A0A7S2SVF9_9STRA